MDALLLSKQNRKLDILLLLLVVNHDASLYFCRRSPKEASCYVSLNWPSSLRGDVFLSNC